MKKMANFNPRLTSEGISNNPLWYSQNPFYQSGYGMPNCTCYAWGRFWEIGGGITYPDRKPTLSLGDGGDWYGHTQDGYQRASEPSLGAVICFSQGSNAGHVGIVEQISEDRNTIVTSNSAYQSTFFYTQTLSRENNWTWGNGYTFQGFIINPYTGDTPVPPTPTPTGKNIIPLMLCKSLWGFF